MSRAASYILSAYSFIHSLTQEELLDVGHDEKNGIPIPSFDEKVLIDLCADARAIFQSEENVLYLNGDIIVVGDIHGSLHDLLRIIKFIEENNSKALFLGDYVDRGNFSLECITLLFALKLSKPPDFYLIRGNHEFDYTCRQYGFRNDIIDSIIPSVTLPNTDDQSDNNPSNVERYQSYHVGKNCYQYTEKLYDDFMSAFSYLPICSIVNHSTFCIHGGLSPLLKTVDNIKTEIERPVNNYEENQLLRDLLWSDPSNNKTTPFRENQRGTGYSFNNEAAKLFLNCNGLKRIIRAHQCIKKGISHHFDKMCYTVFSASLYGGNEKSQSGVIKINHIDDSIQYVRFHPIIRLQKKDTVYLKVPPLNSNEQLKFISMKHPKLLFKGITSKIMSSCCQSKYITQKRTIRDSKSLKLHCHANPALIACHKKSINSSLIQFHSSHESVLLNSSDNELANHHVHSKAIKQSVSLPGAQRNVLLDVV